MKRSSRRDFLHTTLTTLAGAGLAGRAVFAQDAGVRPERAAGVAVLNPRARVPVSLIIDDSTCLVNLNRFAMPQFDLAFGGKNDAYHKDWRAWPVEIPDAFVRRFGEWCAAHGVKGKYSIVPYPACVGRLDRLLPGWTQRELEASLDVVRTVMMPNWDIHPEMVTHTRVIDLKTGHPYPQTTTAFMENWDWTTGKSVDEIAAYQAYALQILKNAGLACEGLTTPGGYGSRARPQLAQGTGEALRSVFGAEVPHYFRDLYDTGDRSVAPLIQYARDLESSDPRCVVSIIGCTGDWTGGWDCTEPGGVDKFITADLQAGRMVDVIGRGEPAIMVCHWTGIYWNGQERGFKIFQEVVGRLHARFDHLVWMKLSEIARYWAARELTRIERAGNQLTLHAPFACPQFTLRTAARPGSAPPTLSGGGRPAVPLERAAAVSALASGQWTRTGDDLVVCFDLPKGRSTLQLASA